MVVLVGVEASRGKRRTKGAPLPPSRSAHSCLAEALRPAMPALCVPAQGYDFVHMCREMGVRVQVRRGTALPDCTIFLPPGCH